MQEVHHLYCHSYTHYALQATPERHGSLINESAEKCDEYILHSALPLLLNAFSTAV